MSSQAPMPQGAAGIVGKANRLICEGLATLAGIACGVTTGLVVLETISRYGRLTNVTLAEEYSGYLLAFVGAFGAASSLRNGLFPEIGYVFRAMPPTLQKVLQILALLVGLVVVGIYALQSWTLFTQSMRIGATSQTWLYTPLAIPQFFLFVGIAALEVVLLLSVVETVLALSGNTRAATPAADQTA